MFLYCFSDVTCDNKTVDLNAMDSYCTDSSKFLESIILKFVTFFGKITVKQASLWSYHVTFLYFFLFIERATYININIFTVPNVMILNIVTTWLSCRGTETLSVVPKMHRYRLYFIINKFL